MAVAAYTTDLIDIADLDSTGGTAVEPASVWTAGRSPDEADTDFPIQGTVHASLTMNTTGKAGILVPGVTHTWVSGDYLFGWVIWLAPGAIANYASGGLAILAGESASVFNVYYVGGNDFGSYPYGGWQNFAVDPEMTPDENAGTPSDFDYVGAGANVSSAVSKGNPLGFDVFRRGRGEIRIVGGTSTDADATFAGMATTNDNNSNRWGLFQAIDGGYKWKGLMYFGYGNPTDFTDANKSIVVDNTEWVDSGFNRIEIHNASSVITWTNISITALGTTSKGDLEMIDNATLDDTGGVFTDMGTFIYQSNATITGRTFRRCGLVTQGGGTFDSCVFEETPNDVAIKVDDIDLIDTCGFISDGSSHAIELTSAHAGNSYQITGHSFAGYATSNGSTGNEVIYNNSGGAVTITVTDCTGTVSYRNGTAASTTIIIPDVTLTLTGLVTGSDISILEAGTTTEIDNVQENSGTSYPYSYASGDAGDYVDVGVFKAGYTPKYVRNYQLSASNGTLPIAQEVDAYYLD